MSSELDFMEIYVQRESRSEVSTTVETRVATSDWNTGAKQSSLFNIRLQRAGSGRRHSDSGWALCEQLFLSRAETWGTPRLGFPLGSMWSKIGTRASGRAGMNKLWI